MSLIHTVSLSKSFGNEDLFSDISLSVSANARIGFVGPNGSGKTTLLKIIIGAIRADHGEVEKTKKIKIGYLPQRIHVDWNLSPMEACLSPFENLLLLQQKLHWMEEKISEGKDQDSLLEEYGTLQRYFENEGGYWIESKIRHVLQGLGLSQGEENRPWSQLSGGQRTRAYLAKTLLSSPDVLVLDEPTNHLDIQAIEWLENFIKEFDGAVVMVSHDRYFLDQTVNTIWELNDTFEIYHGNYSAYLQQREARYQRQMDDFDAQQRFILKEEEYIRRNIEGQNTRQAQGRRTRLERLLRDSKVTKPRGSKSLKFRMSDVERSGDLVLRTNQIDVGYHDDQKVLFHVPDITLLRGECAAILGSNGAGKTTFIKTILSLIPPLSGTIELGANLKIGYFAQAHDAMDENSTIYGEISKANPTWFPADIRNYLARFLFTGDDVEKKISVLSGGEKGRLALAVLCMTNANLLLLDEPMNHLDVEAQETLQVVLREFRGTIIVISHDRFLVDSIATQIWDVDGEKQTMTVFKGDYSQYKEWKKNQKSLVGEKDTPLNWEETKKKNSEKKISNNERMRRIKLRDALEKEISEIEKKMEKIVKQMEDVNLNPLALGQLGEEYQKLTLDHDVKFEEWADIIIEED